MMMMINIVSFNCRMSVKNARKLMLNVLQVQYTERKRWAVRHTLGILVTVTSKPMTLARYLSWSK